MLAFRRPTVASKWCYKIAALLSHLLLPLIMLRSPHYRAEMDAYDLRSIGLRFYEHVVSCTVVATRGDGCARRTLTGHRAAGCLALARRVVGAVGLSLLSRPGLAVDRDAVLLVVWPGVCGGRVGEACGGAGLYDCLLYTSPSPRDGLLSRMPSSA